MFFRKRFVMWQDEHFIKAYIYCTLLFNTYVFMLILIVNVPWYPYHLFSQKLQVIIF